MAGNAATKPLEWARAARDAIEFIASEDPFAARLVLERVEDALTHVQAHPNIGTARRIKTFSLGDTPESWNIITVLPLVISHRET